MDSTIARVGSVALTDLKTELTKLSNALQGIYDTMQADMSKVNAFWQDGKYQEFVQNYEPQIRKCEEIANRYTEWCARVLDPTIENVVDVETTDVGGDGAVSGGSVTGAVVGGAAVAGAAAVGVAASGTGVVGKGESERMTGSNSAASSNLNSEESDRVKRFQELYPDASPEFAETYFELSPEQRMEYSKEYMKLHEQHDYDVFRAEDRIKMGSEMRGDGARFAGAYWAGKGIDDRVAADKKYEEGMHKLEESTMELAGMKVPGSTAKDARISIGGDDGIMPNGNNPIIPNVQSRSATGSNITSPASNASDNDDPCKRFGNYHSIPGSPDDYTGKKTINSTKNDGTWTVTGKGHAKGSVPIKMVSVEAGIEGSATYNSGSASNNEEDSFYYKCVQDNE